MKKAATVQATTTINLEGMRDRILAVPSFQERDADGYLRNLAWPVLDESVSTAAFLGAFGIQSTYVMMESDCEDEALAEAVYDGGSCIAWQPTPPAGDGWLLSDIFGHEDGPVAMFIRPTPEPVRQSPHALVAAANRATSDRSVLVAAAGLLAGGSYVDCAEAVLRVVKHMAAAPCAPAAPLVAAPSWTCFHCAETFTTTEAAMEHFGKSEYQKPGCQIDLAEYRRMEESHARHCDDDTELHRQIQRIECEGIRSAERAEEAGYDRGLKDGKVLEICAEHVIAWAASQWRSEVEHRPMQNIHRPRLDQKWRGLLQLLGADDVSLIGPPAPVVGGGAALSGALMIQALRAMDAEARRRGEMFPQTRDEQDESSEAVAKVIKSLEYYTSERQCRNGVPAVKDWPMIPAPVGGGAAEDAAPMQPVVMAKGRLRFRANTAVTSLLEHATALGFGMNELAAEEHSDEDRMQLAQLLGYSIGGYSELSYVSDASYAEAERRADLAQPTIQQESTTP